MGVVAPWQGDDGEEGDIVGSCRTRRLLTNWLTPAGPAAAEIAALTWVVLIAGALIYLAVLGVQGWAVWLAEPERSIAPLLHHRGDTSADGDDAYPNCTAACRQPEVRTVIVSTVVKPAVRAIVPGERLP